MAKHLGVWREVSWHCVGFRVQSLGFRVQGLGLFRVQGLGLRALEVVEFASIVMKQRAKGIQRLRDPL